MISGTEQVQPSGGFPPVLAGPNRLGKARRGVRKPFRASREAMGAYGLPFGLHDALERDLQPFRNREDAFRLAVFMARFWSSPLKLGQAFPVCRVELGKVEALGMTQWRVRRARETLEKVGFLRRKLQPGTGYQRPCAARGARRVAALFEFGFAYFEGFREANKRASRVRARRVAEAGNARPAVAAGLKSPVRKKNEVKEVLTGDLVKRRPLSDASFSRSDGPVVRSPEGQAFFDAVLARVGRGIR